MKKLKRVISLTASACLVTLGCMPLFGCGAGEETVVLRVNSWEEYIDEGGWGDDELIEIEGDFAEDGIFGENSIVDDFTEWFNENHDFNVRVEYSTFGTNEDLYNRLSLGDAYDLVCPSDYMIMKLVDEDKVLPYSESFSDESVKENYYARYVSRYIDMDDDSIFSTYGWSGIAACYMWGTTGLVYNPDKLVNDEDINSLSILTDENYKKQLTIKDNVRDSYFATLAMINEEKLSAISGENAGEEYSKILNDTSDETIAAAQEKLKEIKENVYSFETDSGKADMVTGKVVANYQWSGDSVFILDEADDDESNPYELWYSVPNGCSNLWFDGWVMLKDGIGGNAQKQIAAEAFVNFLSRPDNAIRNMNYIGYTSSIAGDTVFEYLKDNYGVEDDIDEADVYEYDLSHLFGEGYVLSADKNTLDIGENGEINRGRQLFAQYPPKNIIDRCVVMLDFGDKLAAINKMWINVRCLDAKDISPAAIGVTAGIAGAAALAVVLYVFRYKLFIDYKPKKGYSKVEAI